MSAELRQALELVARRYRRVRLWGGLALCWLAWAVAAAGLAGAAARPGGGWVAAPRFLATLAALAAASGAGCAALALRSARDRRWIALRVEARHPALDTGLLAAVERDAAVPAATPGFLETAVLRQALEHRRAHGWDQTVPGWSILGAQLAHAAALAALVVAAAGLTRAADSASARPATPGGPVDPAAVAVDPGDAELERGAPLLVVARFPGGVPADADLAVEGSPRRPMSRSLADPTFAARVESVGADLAYRVEFAGLATPTYHVRVFEYPELRRADARLTFPTYTDLAPKALEDVRHVTAVEGSTLTLDFVLNKAVAEARLADEAGGEVPLTPSAGDPLRYRAEFTLADSHRYKLRLRDDRGRANRGPPEVAVNVTRNRPAAVTVTQPARDLRVSPVEELTLKARAEDDFGVVRRGLVYTPADGAARELVLGGEGPKARRVTAEHLLAFESMNAAPGQLLTYYFWAEDVGPDGRVRRSSGDLFFAEVRPFEEVFRQGEAPPQGSADDEGPQGGNPNGADALVELQKQVINGTWTLSRREAGPKPTAALAADATTLRDAQREVIVKAGALAGRLKDPASKASLQQAAGRMAAAQANLAAAASAPSAAPLTPALADEQAAYQALLKLRAREFEVVRQSRRGGGGGGSPADRQLQQLQLTDDENRYESQRSARDPNSQRDRAQGEDRQVLNRLRELARRQADLNQRLKELQAALEAAKTDEARAEADRQLKRLRDQEQQVLRDTDEVRERMEREENRDRMAEARAQAEQGREQVRQAAEALDAGKVPQAVTAGARAGRQLEDLREGLRKASAGRFNEEAADLRDEARKLAEEQPKLTEALDAAGAGRPRLRDKPEADPARQGLGRQRKRLDALLERVQKTVQDAEETEPLLAKGLFDAAREAADRRVPDALKVAERLAEAGVNDDAAKVSRQAGEGLERLKAGVDRASQAVLGGETAALRRAADEVADLADQVDREIARNTAADPRPGAPPGVAQAGRPRQGGPQGQSPADDPETNQQPGEPDADTPPPPPRQEAQGQRREQPGGQGQPGGQAQAQTKGQGQGGQGQGQAQTKGQGQGQGQTKGQGQGGQGQGDGQGQGQGQRRGGSLRGGGGGDGNGGGGEHDDAAAGGPEGGPVTGEGFRGWSDRMRDVEELLTDPELRAESSKIRDRVRGAREEFKRHSKEPDWAKLRGLVADPIRQLRDRINEEVRRRESPDGLVPIDRDPVPPQFAEGVRRYYERLGSGR